MSHVRLCQASNLKADRVEGNHGDFEAGLFWVIGLVSARGTGEHDFSGLSAEHINKLPEVEEMRLS